MHQQQGRRIFRINEQEEIAGERTMEMPRVSNAWENDGFSLENAWGSKCFCSFYLCFLGLAASRVPLRPPTF